MKFLHQRSWKRLDGMGISNPQIQGVHGRRIPLTSASEHEKSICAQERRSSDALSGMATGSDDTVHTTVYSATASIRHTNMKDHHCLTT